MDLSNKEHGMKFLLVAVNAKYIHSNPAVYSLYAYSKEKYAQSMEIVEFTINQKTEDILAQLYERKPDAIGFSCYIWNWEMVSALLDDLPKVLPETDIWLGGPQVSFNAPQILERFSCIKGIMIGEGEVTFSELLERYVHNYNDITTNYLFTRIIQFWLHYWLHFENGHPADDVNSFLFNA